EPLAPGTHDLAVRTTSPDKALQMLSDQRVAVSVPEDKTGEPLVVVNVPDRPSRVVQRPGAAAGAGTEGAEAQEGRDVAAGAATGAGGVEPGEASRRVAAAGTDGTPGASDAA